LRAGVSRQGARHEDQDQGSRRLSHLYLIAAQRITTSIHSTTGESNMKIKTKIRSGSLRACS
jgi:hypothetical protein